LRQSPAAPAPVASAPGHAAPRLRLFVRRAHNTRTLSDPHRSVDIWAEDWLLVELYRFGSGTAEFFICRRCGVYIGAVCETAAGARAIINTNSLDDRAAFTGRPPPSITTVKQPKAGSPAAQPIGRPRPSTAEKREQVRSS
jgi:hypothetical protein